jgi:hypothetical protein
MPSVNKRNFVAKDLRTPKYKMRVVPTGKLYNRKKENVKLIQELTFGR